MSSILVESRINGTYNGWKGDTIYELTNGQVWKQERYLYFYKYMYRPEVKIVDENGYKMMYVGDDDRGVQVKRIK